MNKVFIIAEAGVNHNGSLIKAKKLVDAAVFAGADAVKFQTFKADNIVSCKAPKAQYQKRNTGSKESLLKMLQKLELSKDNHRILIDYCKKKGIQFLSSPFDIDSVELLDNLKLKIFKIPSGEITNLPYLEKIGKLNKYVIISTGMSFLSEIAIALKVLISSGTLRNKITVLHANTEYPTPFDDVNLKAMISIRDKLKVKVGYSDHTTGIEVPIAAVALGAEVIEKHLTLDKKLSGPDHKASLEPFEFKQMVMQIRNIEKSIGNGIKKPSFSELKNIKIARKSIVAKCEIKKNDILTHNNIAIKRPGIGISPMKWYDVLGKRAKKPYKVDELI